MLVLTVALGGSILLVVTLAVQMRVSYVRWLELGRRGNWRAELPIDFRSAGVHRRTFRPVVSRTHSVWLTLRAPLQGDLVGYRGKDEFLAAEVARRSLAGKEFALSWQILSEDNVLAKGTVCSSDLKAWAMRDHVHYQCVWGLPVLETGEQYTFVAQVEQANPAVNESSPTLLVRTWGSLKGYGLRAWRPWHTVFFSIVGIALLTVAYLRRAHDRRLACSPENRAASPLEVEGIRTKVSTREIVRAVRESRRKR